MRTFRRCLTLMVFALVGFGCGPAVVLQAPAGWPGGVGGRRLYNTPAAYIYASDDVAAAEADGVARSAAGAIARCGGTAVKGLIVVTDVNDVPLAVGAGCHDGDSSACRDDGGRRVFGVARDGAVSCRADPLAAATVSRMLGTPEGGSGAWAVAIPTRGMIDRRLARSWVASVEDQPDMRWKLITAAILPVDVALMLPVWRESRALEREAVIFERMAGGQATWDDATRRARVDEYRNELVTERMWWMPMMWVPPM